MHPLLSDPQMGNTQWKRTRNDINEFAVETALFSIFDGTTIHIMFQANEAALHIAYFVEFAVAETRN